MNGNPFYEIAVMLTGRERIVIGYLSSVSEAIEVKKILERLYPLGYKGYYVYDQKNINEISEVLVNLLNYANRIY